MKQCLQHDRGVDHNHLRSRSSRIA
jgi:hypothetical protein